MRKQIIFPLIFLLFYTSVEAICVWTGAGDGVSFSDDLNWSCGHMPDMADEAVLGSGAMVILDISTMVKELELDGGSISGSEMLIVSDGILWKSGVIAADVALTSGSLSMVSSGTKELSKKLMLETSTFGTWDAGSFLINSGGELILEVGSSFGMTFDGAIDFSTLSPGKIISSGYFEKVSGTDTAYVNAIYENETSGTIAVSSGTLQLVKGIADNIGTMDLDTATFLQVLDSSMHDGSAMLSGKGTLELLEEGPHIFASSFIGDYSVTFNADVVVIDDMWGSSGLVKIESGVLEGTGSLGIDGTGEWTGGLVGLPLSTGAGATLALSGLSTKTLTSTFTQLGSTVWTAGDFAIQDGGIWSNSGTFTAASSGNMTFTGATGTYSNSGNFFKTSMGKLSIAIPFTNGIGGVVGGIDTLLFTGGLTNDGTWSPGLSPGLLVVEGDYSNGKILELEVKDGSGVGLGHDQLLVTGMVSLSDTLKVLETASAPNGVYTLLKCEGGAPCISGSFAKTEVPTGYTLDITTTEITVTKSVLPIELTYFHAKLKDGEVLLSWETASEIDNAFFDVERSFNGIDFIPISRVAGQGNSLTASRYEWTDQPLFGGKVIYYRLRQEDYDGTSSYSDVRAVSWEGESDLAIHRVVWKGSQEVEVFFTGNEKHGDVIMSLSDPFWANTWAKTSPCRTVKYIISMDISRSRRHLHC